MGVAEVARRDAHSAGALCGFTVEVPELVGGVTGEISELEPRTI